jgi:Flp pilus assembly protein CpaB
MNIFNESSKTNTAEYFAAYLKLHNGKILTILLSIILISFVLASKEYLKLKNELKLYNKQELINVLVSKRNIQIGEILQRTDLESIPYPKELFSKIVEQDKSNQLKNLPEENGKKLPSIIPCEFKLNNQESPDLFFDTSIIGKRVRIPIPKGSLIRREHLNDNTHDLLNKLIPVEHILLEYSTENLGANKYLQTGDLISLYDSDKKNSINKITNTAKIILVNSKQDETESNRNSNNKLQLTLAIHRNHYERALLAKVKNQLVIAINNSSELQTTHQLKQITAFTKNLNQRLDHDFQNLIISKGLKERVFN